MLYNTSLSLSYTQQFVPLTQSNTRTEWYQIQVQIQDQVQLSANPRSSPLIPTLQWGRGREISGEVSLAKPQVCPEHNSLPKGPGPERLSPKFVS